jgi:hypothetical protein
VNAHTSVRGTLNRLSGKPRGLIEQNRLQQRIGNHRACIEHDPQALRESRRPHIHFDQRVDRELAIDRRNRTDSLGQQPANALRRMALKFSEKIAFE